jgi:hypothetical protein
MKSYTKYCGTCCLLLVVLFLFTYLGKKTLQFKKTEPFVISSHDTSDVLLDKPTHFKFKYTSYENSQKQRHKTHMSSYEQTNNNQPYHKPDNGSIELPELSGFY